jgi:hypothetical protein
MSDRRNAFAANDPALVDQQQNPRSACRPGASVGTFGALVDAAMLGDKLSAATKDANNDKPKPRMECLSFAYPHTAR